MKSRLAILGMLVAGMLFSTTGVGLAINGLTSSNSASIAQYGGDQGNNGNNGNNGGVQGEGSNSGSPSSGNNAGLQPAQQVEAGANNSSGQLPFTGYAAIPVLLGGIALLSTGLIVRRRTREDD